jgi:hypothetical protein
LILLYDLYVLNFVSTSKGRYLQGIAGANLSYCLLSLLVTGYHWSSVTWLGWLYIIGEVLIVLFLARIEWLAGARERLVV